MLIPLRSYEFWGSETCVLRSWTTMWIHESKAQVSNWKHLLFTTLNSLACAQKNLTWSATKWVNKKTGIKILHCRRKIVSSYIVVLQLCCRVRITPPPTQIPMTWWWNHDKSTHSFTPESASCYTTGFQLLFELGNQRISWLNVVHFSNPIPV